MPRGLIENVLIRVNKYYFSVNFLILDMEPSQELNQNAIILGHPFLATANTNINYKAGAMDISFGDQKVRINVFNSSKYVQKEESYSDSSDLMKDDFLDEPIEEIQVQKMKVLLDSPHPLS